MRAKDSQILKMKEKLNDQKQYVRDWSIRILNLKIPASESTDLETVMLNNFNRVKEPILRGALAKKLISSIPSPHFIMETAHILPAKPDTLIVRFYTRIIRNMLFRIKHDVEPKAPASSRAVTRREPRTLEADTYLYLYTFFGDLTCINFD
jgi:hypothetical protein